MQTHRFFLEEKKNKRTCTLLNQTGTAKHAHTEEKKQTNKRKKKERKKKNSSASIPR